MDYIGELRKLVGHRPIILVGAGVLVTDPQGRLLLTLRSDNHCWGMPGGAMEPGETFEQTAIRETREETGLEIESLRLFQVLSGPEYYYQYPNGDEVYNVSVVFETNQYHGSLDDSNDENLGLRFFAPEEIDLENISPPVRPVLRAWLEKQTNVRA